MESKQIPKASLCIAFDGVSKKDILERWTRELPTGEVVFKLGLGNLPEFDSSDFEKIKSLGFKIFVDAKLHDIPSQVARAVSVWAKRGIDYLTLHLSGGAEMVGAAIDSAQLQGNSTKLLGVSILTSLSSVHLEKMWGIKSDVPPVANNLINQGIQAGLGGFVCSASDLDYLRREILSFDRLLWVTPGIHWPGENPSADQSRSVDFQTALQKGSGMLVMGRSLLGANDTLKRIESVLSFLSKGNQKK